VNATLRKEDIPALKRAIAIAESADAPEPDAASPSTARSLSEWLGDSALLRPPKVIVPYLAIEGRVSLLSGREKIGKSTLAAGAVAKASRGHAVLGVPLITSIKTLWLALDEQVADAVRRFDALGANPEGVVINAEPRTFSELLEALEQDLEEFDGIEHVVVDTFSRVLAVSGVDPNSSREVEPVVATLVDFFHRRNVAATLLYHTGKGGKEYRGSTAIGASVDEVLTLRRRGQGEEDDFEEDGSDDGRRLLVQDGRNLRGRLQLTFRDGHYRLYEETEAPREKILEALRLNGSVGSRAELTRLAHVRKEIGLKVIIELIGSGAILENGRQLRVGSGGSAQFPEKGTNPEPITEPLLSGSSQTGRVAATETGTAPQRATRVVERDGRQVRQELVPLHRGDQWRDVGVA
jgi:hypothetical protein